MLSNVLMTREIPLYSDVSMEYRLLTTMYGLTGHIFLKTSFIFNVLKILDNLIPNDWDWQKVENTLRKVLKLEQVKADITI